MKRDPQQGDKVKHTLKSVQKEVEDLKESMNMMAAKLANINSPQAIITDLLTETKKLKSMNMDNR